MITREELKNLRALRERAERYAQNRFIVEGEHLAEELLAADFKIEKIIVSRSWQEKNSSRLMQFAARYPAAQVNDSEFLKICETKTPQGIAVVAEMPSTPAAAAGDGCVLYLDGIQDPGNVGVILRTARWFGVKHILLSADCADVYNGKTLRSSMGAAFYLSCSTVENPGKEIGRLKQIGFSVWGADSRGENIFVQAAFPANILLILGSEAAGISAELKRAVDTFVSIPRIGAGESLNVASAAAVLLAKISGASR